MKQYDYLIFDFDGTVVDTGEGILNSLRFAFRDQGDDVPDLLLAADLVIHPARNESAGSVLIEALAAGVPVLCSGNCGFADHVRESGGIVLHKPFRQRLLNRTLLRALATPEKIDDMKRNAIGYGQGGDFYRRAEVACDIIRGEA